MTAYPGKVLVRTLQRLYLIDSQDCESASRVSSQAASRKQDLDTPQVLAKRKHLLGTVQRQVNGGSATSG